MDESRLAQRYEARYPGTGCGEAQKEERMERLLFAEERQALRRTSRNRSVVIPRVPWHEKQKEAT